MEDKTEPENETEQLQSTLLETAATVLQIRQRVHIQRAVQRAVWRPDAGHSDLPVCAEKNDARPRGDGSDARVLSLDGRRL